MRDVVPKLQPRHHHLAANGSGVGLHLGADGGNSARMSPCGSTPARPTKVHTIDDVPADLVASRIRAMHLPPFDPLNARAAELRAQGHDVISLGQALPFYPPPAAAIRAAHAAIDDP